MSSTVKALFNFDWRRHETTSSAESDGRETSSSPLHFGRLGP
jgi:hypothetical protein